MEDKQGKWYEEAWHDLLFEPGEPGTLQCSTLRLTWRAEHEQVMEDIANWIDDHA